MCALFYGQFPWAFKKAGSFVYDLVGPKILAAPEQVAEVPLDMAG
jgi:hypothetical protein